MRHRVAGKELSADTQHRLAIRRNLARNLFLHGRVVTTLAKAKVVRRFVEKLITRAKRAVAAKTAGEGARYLHEVRVLARDVQDKPVLKRLLADVAPAAKDRAGGYTRIVRDWKNRVGDNAPRAIFELVDRPAEAAVEAEAPAEAAPEGKGRGRGRGKEPAEKPKGKAPAKAGAKKPAAADDDEE
jgi:large subunit ribosomal protein L17